MTDYPLLHGAFKNIPFQPTARIERWAFEKLEKLSRVTGAPIKLPIDIEYLVEIVERIKIEVFSVTDQTVFGPDVLGAFNFSSKTISLNENCGTEERRRFTLAHEYGHFVMHSPYFGQLSMTFESETKPETDLDDSIYVLRSSFDPTSRLEAQANQFASRILMPTTLVQRLLGENALEPHEESAVLCLSGHAAVSKAAARIRLKSLSEP